MKPHERAMEMLLQISEMNLMLPEIYNHLTMNDWYRLKQLLEEAEQILEKHKKVSI
ncbi:MAG: hypothetical protein ACREBF_00530 [Candidatus Micrarchaeales archaeon]